MQIISPDTINRIGEKIILIGRAADAINAEIKTGNALGLRSARESMAASEADYDKAIADLAPEQRVWVETLFADAVDKARAGRSDYNTATYLAQIKWADDQVRELEAITSELKDARTEWVKGIMSYDVSAYQVAKVCGRTPSTVQRWLE
ncbi:hypothetical protein [Corynebacterium coyleae]|uniref:hypothetical protein n=1 Tax=Corynebacterium coyleae TaxID=53374 RepID=UPI002551460D|nr:hypothetical protein [Corynebacterium coyleae]MDK8242103.1 hypothetical protein [Corynebacterium coyleae]